ncbi:Mov34/MPN/PAD-1 family protein [Enterobacter sp.]|uniref:Mov34/MPN/PAD-1 family protein n=1 Tax=Enterobacter sp. TaxID=42895 RepID=UPI003D0F65E5
MNGNSDSTYIHAWSWCWKDPFFELKVADKAADIFFAHRQTSHLNERGGQIFLDLSCSDGVWLSTATPPHPSDNGARTWLELNPIRCQEEIASNVSRGFVFAGYWHTHPEEIPVISPLDKKSFIEFRRASEPAVDTLLAVIIGFKQGHESIRIWALQNGSFTEGIMHTGSHSQ